MIVRYHSEAEAELVDAARFYEERVPKLGKRFLDEVDRTVAAIVAAPGRWPVLEANVRRYLLRGFPYAIYYRALPDHVRVLAVKHHRRHPEYWRTRR